MFVVLAGRRVWRVRRISRVKRVTPTQNGLSPGNRLNLDPRFVAITGANAFRLRANSPAVDSAWNGVSPWAFDFFGAPRPRGTAADVGAVESY